MQQDGPLRSVLNTSAAPGYAPLNNSYLAAKPGVHRSAAHQDNKGAPFMAHAGGAYQYTHAAAATSADAAAGGPAAKRPRVEDVLQQHAPREQLLVSELMGWRTCSQDPTSAMGGAAGVAAGTAAPTGSTDFRALFARQNSQQLQAQQRAPCAATSGLRTFADVATRPAAAAEDVGRQDVLGAMRAAYNTASVTTCSGLGRSASQQGWTVNEISGAGGAATVDGFGPGFGAAAAAAAAAGSALEDLAPDQLPVDWGIKRGVTFTSSARFAVHDQAQQAPPNTRWRAMQSAINCDLESCSEEVVRYLACQLSWRHPEMQLDAAALAAARSASAAAATGATAGPSSSATPGATGTGCNLLAQRLAAWRNALHSLYGMYRGGDCHVFYLINSAARNPFVALFTYKGVRGCGELCAVVSQSSRLLRGRMLAAGVPFTMPLDRTPAASGAAAAGAAGGNGGGSGKAGYEAAPLRPTEPDEGADVDLVDGSVQARATTAMARVPGATAQDNSRESLLLLRGPRAVHGLYDFLMNDTSYSGQGGRLVAGAVAGPNEELSDLPVLLAPAPFEGGAVWRPTIKAVTMSGRLASEALTGGAASALAAPFGVSTGAAGDPADSSSPLLHVLQVVGPLPPWTVRRMCGVLAHLHPGGYSATLDAEPCSIPLNSRVLEARVGDGAADVEDASAQELRGQKQHQQLHQQLQATFAHGGALSVEELSAWRQPAALPGGRPVKGVACKGVRRLSVQL